MIFSDNFLMHLLYLNKNPQAFTNCYRCLFLREIQRNRLTITIVVHNHQMVALPFLGKIQFLLSYTFRPFRLQCHICGTVSVVFRAV